MSKEDWKVARLRPDCVAVVEWLSGKMPNSAVKCVALSEAELDGVAGGRIKQPGGNAPPLLPVLSLATSLSKPRRGPRPTFGLTPTYKSRTRQATSARCELAAGFLRL